MDKKLTLSLNDKVIEKAKKYAKLNSTSLSKMIEAYFETLTRKQEKCSITTTPLVESLCGVIALPSDFDYKKSRAEYLSEKNK